RTYYFLQLFAAIGYLWMGINKLIDEPTADPLHMVTLGGILGSMMMIWLTAGLWHSGFTKLDYPKLCRLAVLCLFTAALSRACLMVCGRAVFYHDSRYFNCHCVCAVSRNLCADIPKQCLYG
ncbi:MAG: NnrS family protein, partial [Haemophilus parainfluenzae]|nr:NnrS family protein [Haemophilus parainfluenzae]